MTNLIDYFPLYDQSLRDYMCLYSRMIVDCLNNFEEYVEEPNLGGLAFSFIVHANKSEMIEYGRYFSVVSVELIGSKERVWALVFKFYDLAHLCYRTWVLMNPYEGFLKGIASTQILTKLLIGGSVRETVLWLR
jgi:hypothetical protein